MADLLFQLHKFQVVHRLPDNKNNNVIPLNNSKMVLEPERILSAFVENTLQFIGVMTPDGRVVLANKAALAFIQCDLEDVKGELFWETPWWSESEQHIDTIRQAVMRAADGEVVQFQTVTFDKQGRALYVDFSVNPVTDVDGQVSLIIAEARNLSDVKLTTEQLEAERNRVNDILEGTNGGTWDWNIQTNELQVNERWAQIIGKRVKDLKPDISTWVEHVHPDDLAHAQLEMKKHCDGELDYYDVEFRQPHVNGSWKWVNARGKVVERDGQGNPLRMRGTHLDITDRKHIQQQLGDTLKMYQSLMDSLPQNHYRINRDGEIIFVNKFMARYLGKPARKVMGKKLADFYPDELKQRVLAENERILEEGASFNNTLSFTREDRTEFFETHKFPIKDSAGNIVGIQGCFWDVTDEVMAQKSVELAASVFTTAQEGIMIVCPQGKILDVNAAFTRITGYEKADVQGHNPKILKTDRHDDSFFENMWRKLIEQGSWQGEIWNKRKNGEVFPATLYINSTYNSAGIVENYVAVFSDITALKNQQKQLEKLAHYDALTGLPNRVLLADRLKVAFLQAQRKQNSIGVAYIDLDGFKEINDKFGHDFGDQLLVQVARRMKTVLRAADSLARLGGDEFVAVMTDLSDQAQCKGVLERIIAAIGEGFVISGRQLHVTASIGVSFYPQQENIDADQLLRQADQSMYQAKLQGKNQYHLFDPEHDRAAKGRHESLLRIREGLEKQEFELYYQPKVNMQTGKVIGAEALARWNHPEEGLLFPGAFVPLLEDNSIGVDFGNWAIEQGLIQAREWANEGLKLTVSVNLTAYHLQQPDFVDMFKAIIDKVEHADLSELELEILETSALQDIANVTENMKACARLGVGFALDDFGTGYSSLSYLRQLPISSLKIDRSFVNNILEDPEDLTIAHAITGFAKAYKLPVVAEGVETAKHGEVLLKLGCSQAQGYGIAKPMPVDELLPWARAWHTDPLWEGVQLLPQEALPLLFCEIELSGWLNRFIQQGGASRRAQFSDKGFICDELEKWFLQQSENTPGLETLMACYGDMQKQSLQNLKPGEEGEHETGELIQCAETLILALRTTQMRNS